MELGHEVRTNICSCGFRGFRRLFVGWTTSGTEDPRGAGSVIPRMMPSAGRANLICTRCLRRLPTLFLDSGSKHPLVILAGMITSPC